MKLNTNSWHYKFYQFIYEKEPGKGFCEYFHSLWFGIVLLLTCWPKWVIDLFLKDDKSPKSLGAMINIIFVILPYVLSLIPDSQGVKYTFWYNFLFVFALLLVFTLVIGLVVGIVKLIEYLSNSDTKVFNSDAIIMTKTWIKAKKDKYCPVIEWEEHDKK